jgi:hypothetical protein
MPRLMGKDLHAPMYTAIGLLVVILGAVTTLEYIGFIDVVPGFGKGSGLDIRKEPTTRPVSP